MTTPHPVTRDLLVLHTLRCIGHADLQRISDACGLEVADTESELIDLAVDGLVTRTVGAFGAWGLTEAGRTADASRIAAELDASGARPAVEEAYQVFCTLNPAALDLCGAWQLRGGDESRTINDHSDPDYDAKVLGLFARLDQRASVVVDDLAAVLARFGRYRRRLGGALARAQRGEHEFVAESTSSYHAVWFQLHEDLLTTLGIPR